MLRLAMLSSGMSKVTGLGLQALAIPLIYTALGTHGYALYLLLTAALATLSLTQFGAGTSLTQAISRAFALGDRKEEGASLGAGMLFASGMATLGAIALSLTVHVIPAGKLFGASFAGDQALILHTTNVILIITVLVMMFGVVDSALAGYQEQAFTNILTCVGNVVSTVALIIVCRHHPSVETIIIVMYGVSLFSKLASAIYLLIRRPYLVKNFAYVNKKSLKMLMHTGFAFWLMQAFGIVEQHAGTYLLAHMSTPQATDIFAIIYKAVSLAGSIVGIFTQPLWPAYTDAVARHDYGWIRRASSKIRSYLMTTAGVLSLAMIFGGSWGIKIVWHIDVSRYHAVVVLLGVYLFVNLWTHFHYVILMGLDRIWTITGIIACENTLMVILSAFLIPRLQIAGMAIAYLSAALLLPAWLLPALLNSRYAYFKTLETRQSFAS
jgi:O-antigen/teichoic acid export membrane protein